MAQRKVSIELEANTGKATSELEDLRKEIDRLNKEVASGNKETKEGLKGVEKASEKTAKGVGRIGDALKAAGIGLAIAAFAKLTEVFNENQKVTNFFNTTFETLSLTFNDFFNFLNNNIGTVVGYFQNIFSDPKQAIVDFSTSIKTNLIERFNSFLDTLGFLASAVKKVFAGDFAGALDDVKEAGKESIDILTGVPDTFEKVVEVAPKVIKGITDYTKSTIQAAQETVELNRAAEIGIAQNRIILEQKDREAEKLRQIRDDESKTIAERIEANNKLADVLEEQERLMLANADAVIAAAQAQFDKNNNDENQIALLDARAEKEGILAQIEGFRSEQLINKISLDRESGELQKEAIAAEDERIAKIAELTDFQILTGIEKLQRDRDNALAELELLDATEAEKQKIRDHYAEEEEKLTKLTTKQKLDLASNAMGDLAAIFGEESKAGKAAAIAQTTIKTYESATSSYASLAGIPIVGPVLGGIAAAAAVAAGIANVKKITSIGPSVSGGKGGGSAAPSRPAPPSFNVVGAAPESQLAQTIGEREQQPVKAFVVSNDVTTAQSLDRNIIESASI